MEFVPIDCISDYPADLSGQYLQLIYFLLLRIKTFTF